MPTDASSLSSLLSGANAIYLSQLYERYLNDPNSVESEWRSIFVTLGDNESANFKPSWQESKQANKVIGAENNGLSMSDYVSAEIDSKQNKIAPPRPISPDIRQETIDSVRALMLIRAYRVRGHLAANLDPLGLQTNRQHQELLLENYGFTESDLDRPIFINYVLGLEKATLREILAICQKTYCGTMGVEFMHMLDPEEKAWIQERMEAADAHRPFTIEGKKTILQRLTQSEMLEKFLDRKYPGTKRFGLDGGETMVPLIEQLLKHGSKLGIEDVVVGMPHRGRLNLLSNIMQKPFPQIFKEFKTGTAFAEDSKSIMDDMKYHLGTSTDRGI